MKPDIYMKHFTLQKIQLYKNSFLKQNSTESIRKTNLVFSLMEDDLNLSKWNMISIILDKEDDFLKTFNW